MDKLLCCTACGVQGEAKCACGKGLTYMPAGKAAALAFKAHPDWSNRRIAEAVGVSDKTIAAAREPTAENSAVEKRVGKDGKARKPRQSKPNQDDAKMARSKQNTPVLDKARNIVRSMIEAGESTNSRKLQEEHGISHVHFETAIAAERARLEAFKEVEIDPTTLSKSAQEKLAAAMRQYRKKLEVEIDAKVRAEAKARIERLILPGLKERQADAECITNARKRGIFKKEEYNAILRCVHPDRSPSIEEKNEAFRILHEKRLLLLSNADDPKKYPKMPTIDEFYRD